MFSTIVALFIRCFCFLGGCWNVANLSLTIALLGTPINVKRYLVESLAKSNEFRSCVYSFTDMESALSRQRQKQQLNKAPRSHRNFHEFLDVSEKDGSDLGSGANNSNKPPVRQRPGPRVQQLHLVVDPDVMEYVTSTSHYGQMKKTLALKKSEIKWKSNSKTAVIMYRGQDESDSWQSECIEEVQNYLSKFTKRNVEVNKDFWEAVKTQVSSIRASFGIDPPLVKTIDDSFVAKIVSLSSDGRKYEDQLKEKLEEIYHEETRKCYPKTTKKVPVERLVLLKKIKFAENLQGNNKELEIKLNTEAEEIYFEGPQPQFAEAIAKFEKLNAEMVEKNLSLSKSTLEVLGSDQGLQRVKCELEKNAVEAVLVIDNDARMVGTSAKHAEKAASLVRKLTLEEKVRVDEKSQHLLKTMGWHQLCKKFNTGDVVRVYGNNWSDTFVAGFCEDVIEAMKALNAYLEKNCICEERFVCLSKLTRRYLSEIRQDDLHLIEAQLTDFEVKIQNQRDDLVISGKKEGLECAKKKLNDLLVENASEKFDVEQLGLRKFFASGRGDRLVKSVEQDHACVIHVQTSFDKKQGDMVTQETEAAMGYCAARGVDENKKSADDKGDKEDNGSSALVMPNGQKISWKAGHIEMEKVITSSLIWL